MAILLLLPFLIIRFGGLFLLDKTAIQRAAHFAPMENKQKAAYWLYQFSNVAIFVSLFFLKIELSPAPLFYAGLLLYLAGNLLLVVAVVNFAFPAENGINQKGLYRISRNPMYVAYFIVFIACALLTQSLVFLIFVLLFQSSAHWIILAEEKWCTEVFGEEYRQYCKQVRRYI